MLEKIPADESEKPSLPQYNQDNKEAGNLVVFDLSVILIAFTSTTKRASLVQVSYLDQGCHVATFTYWIVSRWQGTRLWRKLALRL